MNLTDEQLLRRAYIELDAITSTDLERELMRRFAHLLDELAGYDAISDQLEGFDLAETKDIEELRGIFAFAEDNSIKHVKPLLDVLGDFDIHEAAELRKVLVRNQQFEDLLNDLATPLASLQALVNT